MLGSGLPLFGALQRDKLIHLTTKAYDSGFVQSHYAAKRPCRLNCQLQGRRATTHWAFIELLPLVGATCEKGRVVEDGSVITAGGVTSGIDFGLRVVAEIAGDSVAQAIQLGLEYDPDPPFASGHPDRASATVKIMVSPRYETARANFRAELSRVTGSVTRAHLPLPPGNGKGATAAQVTLNQPRQGRGEWGSSRSLTSIALRWTVIG